MNNLALIQDRYDQAVDWCTAHLGGIVSIGLRLILAPVMISAGWEKISGSNSARK